MLIKTLIFSTDENSLCVQADAFQVHVLFKLNYHIKLFYLIYHLLSQQRWKYWTKEIRNKFSMNIIQSEKSFHYHLIRMKLLLLTCSITAAVSTEPSCFSKICFSWLVTKLKSAVLALTSYPNSSTETQLPRLSQNVLLGGPVLSNLLCNQFNGCNFLLHPSFAWICITYEFPFPLLLILFPDWSG